MVCHLQLNIRHVIYHASIALYQPPTCLHSFKCFYLDSRDLNSAASLDTLDRNSLPEPGSKCPIKSLISKSIDNFQSNLNNRIFLYFISKLRALYFALYVMDGFQRFREKEFDLRPFFTGKLGLKSPKIS